MGKGFLGRGHLTKIENKKPLPKNSF